MVAILLTIEPLFAIESSKQCRNTLNHPIDKMNLALELIQNFSTPVNAEITNQDFKVHLFPDNTQKAIIEETQWYKVSSFLKKIIGLKKNSQTIEEYIEPSFDLQSASNKIDRAELGKSNSRDRHTILYRNNGTGFLHIGFLKGHERELMAEVIPIVKKGLISKIDAGLIAGPKALKLLLKISSYAPDNSPMVITGILSLPELIYEFSKQTQNENSENRFHNWTRFEIIYFQEALQALKVKEASTYFFGDKTEDWSWMKFRFTSKQVDQILWKPIDPD